MPLAIVAVAYGRAAEWPETIPASPAEMAFEMSIEISERLC